MIRLIISTVFLLSAAFVLEADQTYKNIVVVSYLVQEDADRALETVESFLDAEADISALKKENGFNYISRTSGNFFIVSIEPFRNDKVMYSVLNRVQKKFSDAFIYTHWGDDTVDVPKVVEQEFVVIEKVRFESEENEILLWFGVVVLALVGLILIIRSSRQSKTIAATDSQMQQSLEKNETLLRNVTEKIQKPVEEIIQHSEKMLQESLSEKQSDELEHIRSSDVLLLDITNDLVDFLKLQSGKFEIQNAAFNFNNVLDEAAGTVSAKARGRTVEFIFDVDKNVPTRVIGDPLRLSQLLTNLLGNAMKFTDRGEVRLKVKRLEEGSAEDVMLQFEIIDTGKGIEEELIDDIFTPFSSANDRNQTGMGLYISKKIAQLMHGDIRVESVVGKGTTFIVKILLSIENLNEKRQYRLPSKSHTGYNILIVDDHQNGAAALKKMLEYFHHHVEVKMPSEIYNDLSIVSGYKIIIIDEKLLKPIMMNVIKELKQTGEFKLVSVGSMLSMHRADKYDSDMIDGRITKPFSQQRVLELLLGLFDEKEAAGGKARVVQKEKQTVDTPHPEKEIETHEDVPIAADITRESFNVFSGASILIAEDNMINQKVLKGLLGSSGIRLTIADNGQEALDRLHSMKKVDLVLMDINMPVMDGYEATREIRSDDTFNTIPVISLTGLGLPEEIDKMYDFGMNAHLIKPLQIGALYTVFSRYLKKGSTDVKSSEMKILPFKESETIFFTEGLERASGDKELYIEILREFAALYENAADELYSMITTDNLESAKKLCLDVRGVAANIGAKPLAETAAQLHEALVKEKEENLVDLSGIFKRQLKELLEAISGQF